MFPWYDTKKKVLGPKSIKSSIKKFPSSSMWGELFLKKKRENLKLTALFCLWEEKYKWYPRDTFKQLEDGKK